MIGVELRPNLKPLPILAISKSSRFKHAGLPKLVQGVFKFDYEKDYYSAIANLMGYTGSTKNPGMGRHYFMHEYNHFLSKFSLSSKKVPIWYEEGRAEYLATFKFDGEKIYLGDSQAILNRASSLYAKGVLQNIQSEEILTAKNLPKGNDQVLDFYARAFFIVHYLNSSIELRKSLAVYLNAVDANVSEADALQKAFGQSFKEFYDSIKRYMLNSMMMRVISVKEGKIEFPEPDIAVSAMTPEAFKAEAAYFFLNKIQHDTGSKPVSCMC